MLPTYRGFSSVGVAGSDTRLSDKALVNADLLNHFLIVPGEVPGHPGFGCTIRQALAEPQDTQTKDAVISEVNRVISNDPRVRLVSLTVNDDADNQEITVATLLEYIELGEQDFLNIVFK